MAALVDRLRSQVAASAEFRGLSAQLYAEVRSSLQDENLPAFGQLSENEQRVLVQRARDALGDSEAFAACRDATWRALDTILDAEAEAMATRSGALSSTTARHSSKLDAIIELAASGATTLLSRWPQQQGSLLWLINAELPAPLRLMLWRLKLRAPEERRSFEAKLRESRLATISLRDGAVLRHCQAALQMAEPELLAQLPRMKVCVSYADSLAPLDGMPATAPSAVQRAGGEGAALAALMHGRSVAPECFWALPLLRVVPADDEAELVERYAALLAASKPQLRMHETLSAADAELAQHIDSLSGGTDALGELLSVPASRLCVGWLSPDATLFTWDLCLLAGWRCVERVMASALICMRTGLMGCADLSAFASYLAESVRQVTVAQLREALEMHFGSKIRGESLAPRSEALLELSPSDLVDPQRSE